LAGSLPVPSGLCAADSADGVGVISNFFSLSWAAVYSRSFKANGVVPLAANPLDPLLGVSTESELELLAFAPNADIDPKLGEGIVLSNEDWPKAGFCALVFIIGVSGVLLTPPPDPNAETSGEVCAGGCDGELKGEDPVFITPKALYPVPLRNGLPLAVEGVFSCESDLRKRYH
jgi:hypothetical protein